LEDSAASPPGCAAGHRRWRVQEAKAPPEKQAGDACLTTMCQSKTLPLFHTPRTTPGPTFGRQLRCLRSSSRRFFCLGRDHLQSKPVSLNLGDFTRPFSWISGGVSLFRCVLLSGGRAGSDRARGEGEHAEAIARRRARPNGGNHPAKGSTTARSRTPGQRPAKDCPLHRPAKFPSEAKGEDIMPLCQPVGRAAGSRAVHV